MTSHGLLVGKSELAAFAIQRANSYNGGAGEQKQRPGAISIHKKRPCGDVTPEKYEYGTIQLALSQHNTQATRHLGGSNVYATHHNGGIRRRDQGTTNGAQRVNTKSILITVRLIGRSYRLNTLCPISKVHPGTRSKNNKHSIPDILQAHGV